MLSLRSQVPGSQGLYKSPVATLTSDLIVNGFKITKVYSLTVLEVRNPNRFLQG